MALNRAVAVCSGELLVFLDVRQDVHPDALLELASCFADPSIGAASGELILTSGVGKSANDGLGIYWKIEKIVRRLESQSGSVVGATGAIYALRRTLFHEIPANTLLDDVYIPMQAIRDGWRVVFQPSAIARDQLFAETGKEFSRKVRTLSGNYQLIRLAPWLLTSENQILFRFISHKMLRLVVPFLLIAMLFSSAFQGSSIYKAMFSLQLIFYGLAVLGLWRSVRAFKPVGIAYTFATLNVAALVAFWNFISRKQDVWR